VSAMVEEAIRSCCMTLPAPVTRGTAAALQINPITVLGLTETSAVPPGGWLLQTAAGSVSRV
jgi:NADPH:quinone reductase-like Zn-dependent oxidoreductase